MESLTVRHLPFWNSDGPNQMAADEVMLGAAVQGKASFRLYAWTTPTVSLGYFQSHLVIGNKGLTNLPLVRRPTGGLTLVHHHELTYSLALPANYARQSPIWWLEQIHRVIGDLLIELKVEATQAGFAFDQDETDLLCFQHITPGDLTIDRRKIVGSAQRRHRGVLLQHGAILLSTSPFTSDLPGIKQLAGKHLNTGELCQAFPKYLQKAFEWDFLEENWSNQELNLIKNLVKEKYANRCWNEKR